MRHQLLFLVGGILAIGWGVGVWISGGFYYGEGVGRTYVTADFHPGIFWGGILTAIIVGAFILCIVWFRRFPPKDDRSHRPNALQGGKVPTIERVVMLTG